MGRKIDILLTCDVNGSTYELVSCELKPDTASSITSAVQLNKNIRINKSILTRILSCIPDENTFVIALDVKGNCSILILTCLHVYQRLPNFFIVFKDYLVFFIL